MTRCSFSVDIIHRREILGWLTSLREYPMMQGNIGVNSSSTRERDLHARQWQDSDQRFVVAADPLGCEGIEVKLRLAYMTGQYPRATDTFIQREVAALRRLGYHVQTFSVRKPSSDEREWPETALERNSTIYLLPPRGLVSAHVFQLFSAPRRYFSALALAWKTCPPGIRAIARQIAYFAEAAMLARLIKKHSISHLHNHFADACCSVAMIAAEMGDFTFSFTLHGPGIFYEAKHWWIGEKIRRALFVNCISHFCRSQAMFFAPPDYWNKLRIVHCGVDPNLYELKTHQGRGERLLFVGRLTAAKGLPILLMAVAKLERVSLDIVGDGPDRELLKNEVRALNISDRVKFLGYQSQHQIRELLQYTDVFSMCSFAEGVPVVLMEAMASGVPVVATRIAGIPELVQEGLTGLLVAPGDANATTNAIGRLIEDANLRNRFAVAGREKVVREFNIHTEARWLAAILRGALAGKNEGIRPGSMQ